MAHQLACSCGETFDSYSDFTDHRDEEMVSETVDAVKDAVNEHPNHSFLDYSLIFENVFYVDIDLGNTPKMNIRKFIDAGIDVKTFYTNVESADYDVDNMVRLWIDLPE